MKRSVSEPTMDIPRHSTPAADWGLPPKRARTAARPHEPLHRFLAHHHTLLTQGDRRLESTLFHAGRLVHSDPDRERSLFYGIDPTTGKAQFEWARTHYALARKVEWKTDHVAGCSGFAPAEDKPASVLGKVLAGCTCPLEVHHKGWIWLISPKDLTVTRDTASGVETIRHHDKKELMPTRSL
jgi:hypothetical protein